MGRKTDVAVLVKALVIWGFLGWGAPSALADTLADFQQAQAIFEQGLKGDEGKNQQAGVAFHALSAQDPASPLFLVYEGATVALKAKFAWAPWTKMRLGEEGLALIDKALRRLKPEHETQLMRGASVAMETRLVAITTFLQAPDSVFHRAEQGRNLLAFSLKAPAFAQSPGSLQARFFALAAQVAKAQNDPAGERQYLRASLSADDKGPDAEACRLRLQALGG